MQGIEIRRPQEEDMLPLSHFFCIVVTDTYAREGLAERLDDISNEIEVKKGYLKSDLLHEVNGRYFLIALEEDRIVGTIEYGPSNHLIQSMTNGALSNIVEIGTLFVHPLCQGRGIGNLLLKAMCLTLRTRGIEEFCLDSGYTNAKKIWTRKFGEPNYLIPDYWGVGYDHMIWRVKISEMS